MLRVVQVLENLGRRGAAADTDVWVGGTLTKAAAERGPAAPQSPLSAVLLAIKVFEWF